MFTQKELKDAIALCKSQLKELGYEVPSITQYRTTNRMTRSLGNCATLYSRSMQQFTSIIITLSNDLTPKIMPNTLMHEMIHAIYPFDKHGYQFQMLAQKVNRAFGYHITTYASGESKEVIREVRREKNQQVIVECVSCGTQSRLNPRSRTIKNALNGLCTCNECRGKTFKIV